MSNKYTEISTLNPHNEGFGFYVYGTLPLYLVRYVAEWVGMTGYDEVNLVGRFCSAVFDLGVVLLIYLIVLRVYRNYRMALMASAFSAFAVMQIQLSHYFTVDTFANFFIFLSFSIVESSLRNILSIVGLISNIDPGKMQHNLSLSCFLGESTVKA